MNIHKTAIVSDKAKIAKNVVIGPYAVITDNVQIGEGTLVGEHVVIDGSTVIGKNCKIFAHAVIGKVPQDLKFKGQQSRLKIGDNNIIREFCTFNTGTLEETDGTTMVGNGNLFMAYTHVAHDCHIGDGCVIANVGTLAGHVTIEDKAVIGGIVAVHQFCRVGKLSIIGGCSKVVQDVPPFSTCDGHPTKVYGVNLIGLKRAGVKNETINDLKQAFKILFFSAHTISHAVELVKKEIPSSAEIEYLLNFIASSKRGIGK
jgi:UDP-N-acetylglucosamine acyltransferase